MRMCRLTSATSLVSNAAATAARAMRPLSARRKPSASSPGKLFSYYCFDGTRGVGRIYADGSVVGTLQAAGKSRTLRRDAVGTIQVTSSVDLRFPARRAVSSPASMSCRRAARAFAARFRVSVSLTAISFSTIPAWETRVLDDARRSGGRPRQAPRPTIPAAARHIRRPRRAKPPRRFARVGA